MKIETNVSLSKHTSFRTGGEARFFVEVGSIEELKEVVGRAKAEDLPYLVLGEGTNTLVKDEGFPGYVIRPMIMGVNFLPDGTYGVRNSDDMDEVSGNVVAGAGENWDKLVAMTVEKNLSGLENMSLIPGSVGAAPVQNIGAYGSELKDVLQWVEVFDPKTGSARIVQNEECRFGYRDSLFKTEDGRKLIITRIAIKLVPAGKPNILYKDLAKFFADKTSQGELPTIAEVREAVIKIRRDKLPDVAKVGTAGSFFKNPIIPEAKYAKLLEKFPNLPAFSTNEGFKKIPLAWVLDKVCGLNGFKDGEVGLYVTQPLAVVNYGNATTADIKNFAKKVADIVKEKTNLEIEWEVNLV